MRRILFLGWLLFALAYTLPVFAQALSPSEESEELPVTEAEPVEDIPATPGEVPVQIISPTPDAPTAAPVPAPPPQPRNFNTAILQGLNKVTAISSTIEAPLGEVVRFGNLEIIARSCWHSGALTRAENAALLEVWELKSSESPARLFMGWMFASSPSLTALQHPVYDLVVVRCEDRALKDE